MDIECRQWVQHMDSELRRWMGEQNALNRQLVDKLANLEQENKKLTEQLGQVRPIRIDAIHYKVQELSVRELSGTLNIGVSALTTSDEIAKWAASIDDSTDAAEGMDQAAELSDLEGTNSLHSNPL